MAGRPAGVRLRGDGVAPVRERTRPDLDREGRRRPGWRQRLVVIALSVLAVTGCGFETEGDAGDGDVDREGSADVRVAVASNFARPHRILAEAFTAETGVRVRTSLGSTGGLYAQIRNGAPYDVFLAADRARPRRLIREGLALAGSRFTYAEGRLVLFMPGLSPRRSLSAALLDEGLRHLALADPEAAPYGAAAREVLRRVGLDAALSDRVVQAENVSQVLQYVVSGAAEAGFVAASHVVDQPEESYVLVADSLHPPIRQDAVLTASGAGRQGARRFLDFLRSERTREVLERFGYRSPTAAEGADPEPSATSASEEGDAHVGRDPDPRTRRP